MTRAPSKNMNRQAIQSEIIAIIRRVGPSAESDVIRCLEHTVETSATEEEYSEVIDNMLDAGLLACGMCSTRLADGSVCHEPELRLAAKSAPPRASRRVDAVELSYAAEVRAFAM
mgnify:CR=1 FL=1